MTQTVAIVEDPFDVNGTLVFDVPDIRDLLVEHYRRAPEGLRIYHMQIADDLDVTPADEDDWNKLAELPGPFYVTVMPQGLEIATIALIISIALAVVAVGMAFLLRPSIPNTKTPTNTPGSSNNQLGDRQNVARPLQRIEDIFGTVRSTPSLIGFPYKVFETKLQEVEYAIMCVGRGYHAIFDVRDGQTKVSDIKGMSVEVYDPFTSPLSGDPPVTRIGDPITEPLMTVIPVTGVSGQTLYSSNYKRYNNHTNLEAYSAGYVFETDGAADWTKIFDADERLVLTNCTYTDGVTSVNLDGTYDIDHVEADKIYLVSPELVNSDWNLITNFTGDHTGIFPASNANIAAPGFDGDTAVGPFEFDIDDMEQLWFTFVAEGGIYQVYASDGTQISHEVVLHIDIAPKNEDGTWGAYVEQDVTLEGSVSTKSTLGFTFKIDPGFVGKGRVYIRRGTVTNYTFAGTVVDEIKWRNLYVAAPVDQTDFGNVTTVWARTPSSPAALGVKERKLNMNATRKVLERNGDDTFGPAYVATKSVAYALCAAALDPYIGNVALAELNVAQIFNTIDAVQTYFGAYEAGWFGHTFDDDSVSPEEIFTAMATAAFCQPIRRGSVMELVFEQPTTDSILLFNHRNKIPGTEQRAWRFGNNNDNDGVEFTWYDKDNYDTPTIYRIPEDGSATRPKKIDGIGIRFYNQMYWHAWREYNKIRYQHVGVQFDATREAIIIGRLDRVLATNNVEDQTDEGEVVAQAGLTLTLSQDFNFDHTSAYSIFLQIPNGTVDSIPITPVGGDLRSVVLDHAPSSALALDGANMRRAQYWIVKDTDSQPQAFLVSEKEQRDQLVFSLKLINYDLRYYQNDPEMPVHYAIDTSDMPLLDDNETPIELV
jgi:hypothetical protein